MLNKSKIIFFSSILALTSISPNFNFIKANSFDSETKVIKSFFGDNVFSNIEGYTSKKVTEDCGIKHIVKDTLLKDLGTVEEHTRIDSLEVNLDTISDSSNDKSLCAKIKDKFGLDVVYAGDKSTTSNKSDSSGTAKITITVNYEISTYRNQEYINITKATGKLTACNGNSHTFGNGVSVTSNTYSVGQSGFTKKSGFKNYNYNGSASCSVGSTWSYSPSNWKAICSETSCQAGANQSIKLKRRSSTWSLNLTNNY